MLAGYSRRLTRKSTSSTPANPNPDESVNLLSALCSLLVEASEKGFSLDSIALDTVVQSLQALNCVRATRRRPKPPKSASILTVRGLWLEPRLHN
jgi:hypothetical protein